LVDLDFGGDVDGRLTFQMLDSDDMSEVARLTWTTVLSED